MTYVAILKMSVQELEFRGCISDPVALEAGKSKMQVPARLPPGEGPLPGSLPGNLCVSSRGRRTKILVLITKVLKTIKQWP